MKKIGVIFVIILLVCLSIFMAYNFKDEDNTIIKDDLGNTLALMVSYDQGQNYDNYESESWPSKEYKFKEAKCLNSNGKPVENVLTFNEDKRLAEITTSQSISCTLYFDYSLLNVLRQNDPNEVLSREKFGDMYRYQGLASKYSSDGKVVDNNYICFGTYSKEECINNFDKYMYRIIGINDNNNLKLIKATFLKENGILIAPQWDNIRFLTSPYTANTDNYCGEENCIWPVSALYKRLNGLSNGDTIGSSGNTNIFIDSTEYDYMKKDSDWYNIIKSYDWYYGDTFNDGSFDSDTIYKIENGLIPTTHVWPMLGEEKPNFTKHPVTWSDTINAKIGLQYIHDYFYAAIDGKPINAENAKKSWIFGENTGNINSREWLLTRWGANLISYIDVTAATIQTDGSLSNNTNHLSAQNTVRPVFYINENIRLQGSGAIDNPYIIKKNLN